MMKSICNIIWVDDDIDNICPEIGLGGLKRELKRANIEVIGKARSFAEFEELMRVCYDRVDAVITDANFNKTSPAPAADTDFTGFVKISRVMDTYNQKRTIPFYLYTGKKRYFNTFQNGEFDDFILNGRFFEKGCDCEKMFKKIREEVEHVNSRSFRIRKKYSEELSAAALIKGNEECLMNALLYDYSEEWENTEDYFTPIRKIVESIFDECKRLQIIPPINELNTIGKFVNHGKYDNFCVKLKEEIMPKPLARSLWYFLDITQDGSHNKNDLKLGVHEYVRDTRNINLFRSVLYIAMDLCLWFKKVKEEAQNQDFIPKWNCIEKLDLEDEKTSYESKIFTPQEDKDLGVWFCEKCVVGIHTWESGKSIKLKNISNNTNNKTKKKYPYYAKYEIIK